MNSPKIFLLLLLFAIFISCQSRQPGKSVFYAPAPYSDEQFAEYWYSGEAEIATYKLLQHRYGEVRDGHTTLIFVTEPFSRSKQVKLDRPESDNADHVTVMKMNQTKKFITGIYPYSMMLSVFTPVDAYHHPQTLKTTMSSQEWCGQSWSQFNLRDNRYMYHGFSYFESEGDDSEMLPYAILEDELWTRIRLNPDALPTGEIRLYHSSFHHRLAHQSYELRTATATLDATDRNTRIYSIRYEDGMRELHIHFDAAFPYTIREWREVNRNTDGSEAITRGELMKVINTPYWQQNAKEFEYLRDTLMLR